MALGGGAGLAGGRKVASEREGISNLKLKNIFRGRFRAKREHLKPVQELLPVSQGRNLALTVLCVPFSLDIGTGAQPFIYGAAMKA